MNTLSELKEQLIQEKLFDDRRPIKGCEDSEIESIRVNQDVKRLPKMYIEFARLMGNGAGFLFETDATCKELLGVKMRVGERFRHSFNKQKFILPNNAFIYDFSWDYFTYFLDDNDEENPAVYRYIAPMSKNPERVSSFWDDLLQRYQAISQLKKEKEQYLKKTGERLVQAELERRKRVKEQQKKQN